MGLRRRIRARLDRLLAQRGYALISHWRLKKWDQSAHIRRLFDLLSIDTVIDVGANIGQYHEFLRLHVGYGGRLVSLEPVSEMYERLRAMAAQDPLWTVHRLALGTVESSLAINVYRERTLTSFLPRNEATLRKLGYEKYLRETELDTVEHVPVRRLDAAICDLVPDRARVFVKSDTQGYDMNVLRGAAGCLDRLVAFQVELSVKHVYQGSTPYLDAIAEIDGMGYDITGMYPVQRDTCERVVNFDCVFIRRDECDRLRDTRK